MRKVLIIGADFFPSNLPPALRIRFFAQHLADFGWQPLVVTTDPRYYEGVVDPACEKLLPCDLRVVRTAALPVSLTRRFGIGDIGIRSLWHHWRVIKEVCKNEEIDLAFIPIPQAFSAILGRMVHWKFKVPYVIDYIDPWVTLDYWKLPNTERPFKRTLSYLLSRMLEPFALRRVSHLIGVSKATTGAVITRYSWLYEEDTTEIPFGGEPSDFDYLRQNPRQNPIFNGNGKFIHISYVGRGGFDMLPALKAIFEAVRLGASRSPYLFSRIRLHFIGTTYDPNPTGISQISALAKEFHLEELVDEHPRRIPYLDAIQILLDSHALFAIGSDRPHYTASKIFPYILSCRPFLAVFHEESSVVKILEETKAGRVITFNSEHSPMEKVDEISRRLEEILSLPSDYQVGTDWRAFEFYTARAMTQKLAAVFDRVVNKGPK